MILGIGVDIVEVQRIRRAVDAYGERFVRRVFTDCEAAYCRRCAHPDQRFATRFAAKEAALKALGVGWAQGLQFVDVEVVNNDLGAPSIALSGAAADRAYSMGVERIHVSLTHHRHFAIAQVLLEGRPPMP
ncbi:MAG: holo-ACP synthase [Candidatus Brocadiaceae bacterium]|nr:holo-ACP synthase [Candidatus Brocadiaceae bacterium]